MSADVRTAMRRARHIPWRRYLWLSYALDFTFVFLLVLGLWIQAIGDDPEDWPAFMYHYTKLEEYGDEIDQILDDAIEAADEEKEG